MRSFKSKEVRIKNELIIKIRKMSEELGVPEYVIRNLAIALGLKQLDNLVKSKNLKSEDLKKLLKSILILGD